MKMSVTGHSEGSGLLIETIASRVGVEPGLWAVWNPAQIVGDQAVEVLWEGALVVCGITLYRSLNGLELFPTIL